MILGNKCDMEDKRRISTEQGKQLADEYGVKFMETSAMNRTNVEQAFTEIATDIKKKMDAKVGCLGGRGLACCLSFLLRSRLFLATGGVLRWECTLRRLALCSYSVEVSSPFTAFHV